MLYNVGMYGGSFDPLHIGHINCIIEAASKCQELPASLQLSSFTPCEWEMSEECGLDWQGAARAHSF